MTDKKYFNRVYSYFEGKMNKSKKLEFEQELNTNAELKKEFDLQKQLNGFLDNDLPKLKLCF